VWLSFALTMASTKQANRLSPPLNIFQQYAQFVHDNASIVK
jgi:hypothetical protein